MKYAWVENNMVHDICPGNPAECYHSAIAGNYSTEIPDDVVRGATLVEGVWANPTSPETPVAASAAITVSPVEFKLLWTSPERIKIKELRTTDGVIEDLYSIWEDPRLTLVNLSLQSTQQAVDYLLAKLVTAEVITSGDVAGRRAAILSGQFL